MEEENQDENDGWEGALSRYGLPARPGDRSAIIVDLEEQILLEQDAKDQDLMRMLCGQLFSLAVVEDSLLIWRAKECDWDTHCGIDVQLLCGAGLDQTKAYLKGVGTEEAVAALAYLERCESTGDFERFSPERELAQHRRNWGIDPV